MFILVLLLAGVMAAVYPNNFPTALNIQAVLLNLAPVGILVCGMMLLMITGTFDLTGGSTLALAGVWARVVASPERLDLGPWDGLLAGLVVGG